MQRTNQRKTKNHNDQYTYYSMELYPTGGILMCLVWGPRAGIIVVVVVVVVAVVVVVVVVVDG